MVQLGLDSVLSSTEHLGAMAKTKARRPLDSWIRAPASLPPEW